LASYERTPINTHFNLAESVWSVHVVDHVAYKLYFSQLALTPAGTQESPLLMHQVVGIYCYPVEQQDLARDSLHSGPRGVVVAPLDLTSDQQVKRPVCTREEHE